MDNNCKNSIDGTNKNIFKENFEKIILKKSKINDFIKTVQNNKNQSNNTSLNKDNKYFSSQSNTLEVSKDYRIITESNKQSYLLSSDKKESSNYINNKKDKNKKNNKDKKIITNKYDLFSPSHSISINNNRNIKTPKAECKYNKNKLKYIPKKKIQPINIGLSNTNKLNDNKSLKIKKKLYKNFRIITENNYDNDDNNENENESLNIRKTQQNTFNYDNIRLVKMPETNDSNILFYNKNISNKNRSINTDIIMKSKKNRNLSLAISKRNANINRHKKIYSLNEDINKRNTTHISSSEYKKRRNKFNNIYLDTERISSNENVSLEKDISNISHKNKNNLMKTLFIKTNNNNNKEKHYYSSEEKAKNKKINYGKDLRIKTNFNFNEIEKILNIDNNKINEDEIINEIEISNIPDSLLVEIPEEDIQESDNNIKKIKNNKNKKKINLNRENNKKKEKNIKSKFQLFLNDKMINVTTNNIKEGYRGGVYDEKVKNRTSTCTTKNKIRKITEYFNNNNNNNKSNKKNNYICHTVRNNISRTKILFSEPKDYKNTHDNDNENETINDQNILENKNKFKEERYNKLINHIEEVKKEEEKVLILKEKYQDLINVLNNDYNMFNNKKANEIISFENKKKEELEEIRKEKNKILKDEELSNKNINKSNNKQIIELKGIINRLKEVLIIQDNIYNNSLENMKKKIEMKNKENNDLELKIKIYKSIIDNNKNECLNINDINNLIINNSYNNSNQKVERNTKSKTKNQKKIKNFENEPSNQIIKNHLYNKTFYKLNGTFKNISSLLDKNSLTKSNKKNIKFQSNFNKSHKFSELNIKLADSNFDLNSNSKINSKSNILNKKKNKSGKNVLLTSNYIIKSKKLSDNNKNKKFLKHYTNNKKSIMAETNRHNKNKNNLDEIKNHTVTDINKLLNTDKKSTKVIKNNSKPTIINKSSCDLNDIIDNTKSDVLNKKNKGKGNLVKKNKKDKNLKKIEINSTTQKEKEKQSIENKDIKENIIDKYNDYDYDMIFHEKYHPTNIKLKIINQEKTSDGKIITEYSNHKKEIIFNNKDNLVCLKKEIFDDGYQIIYFKNKDIKQIYPNGKEVYFFSENKTVATTFNNGDKIYKFSNGQIEKYFKNGEKTIRYSDGTIRNIYVNGEEEILYNDGSKQKKNKDGTLFIKYKDGVEKTVIFNKKK